MQADSIKTISELRKKKVEMTPAIIDKLRGVIEKSIAKKVKVAMPSVFPTWESYLERYLEVGGVIEAAPSCGPG